MDIIRALVAKGAKLDAINKEKLTPLLLAEKPEPPPQPGNNTDSRTWKPRRDSREEVIAMVRELMHLGKDDPAPVPPELVEQRKLDEQKKAEEQKKGEGAPAKPNTGAQ